MKQVDVTIMGQAYKLACKEGEQDKLLKTVAYVDEIMCRIRENGKIKGTDRIAVMAALTVAADLLEIKVTENLFAEQNLAEVHSQIQSMNNKLDQALATQEDLF